MDIYVAHHAIAQHYKLNDNLDPKSVKLPEYLYVLIHLRDIRDFLSKCRSESLAPTMGGTRTKFAYNNIAPKTMDYLT